ncbi:hypothetical protein NKG94_19325 [Micromonospora sp. M12]
MGAGDLGKLRRARPCGRSTTSATSTAHTAAPLAILASWFLASLGFILLRQRIAQRRSLTAEAGR